MKVWCGKVSGVAEVVEFEKIDFSVFSNRLKFNEIHKWKIDMKKIFYLLMIGITVMLINSCEKK